MSATDLAVSDGRDLDNPVLVMDQLRRDGQITWFADDYGHAFVQPTAGGEPVFVSMSDISRGDRAGLSAGSPVTFVMGRDATGPRALDVRAA